MNKTDYTYAVARIRANELNILSASDYESLLNAADYQSVIRFLNDKGYDIDSGSIYASLEKEEEKAWKLIEESVPESKLLEALIVENDFFNLKAALKATFSGLKPDKYYVSPGITDVELISEAVMHNNFDLLPEYLSKAGKEAYEAFTSEQNGQIIEAITDRHCLQTELYFAEKSGSKLLEKIVKLKCFEANIKTVLRCSGCSKSEDFALSAMCSIPGIDNQKLFINSENTENLCNYISTTEYKAFCSSIRKSFSDFENDIAIFILNLADETKWEIYSADPVVAYWIVKSNEIRNCRILLSGKQNGISQDEIRKKMRVVNV